MSFVAGSQNSLFCNEIIDRQFYVLLTYELQRKKMYKIAQRVIILISNFGVQYLFSLLTYGFDIICGDIQAGVRIKDVRKILRIAILQFQNDNGFTSVVLQFFDSLRDFPRRTLLYLPYYITFPLTLIATQSKHSLSAKRFFSSEVMPELEKHPEVRIPFTFQWIFRDIGISLSTLPTTLFDPIDPEPDNEKLDLIDQENSDLDFDIDSDENQNVNNEQNEIELTETNEEKETQKSSNNEIKNKRKITFVTEKPNLNELNNGQKTEIETDTKTLSNDQSKSETKIKEEPIPPKKAINQNEQYDYNSSSSSNIKIVSLYSVFEEYNRDNINVLETSFLQLFFGSFSPTISLSSFIVTISSENFNFLDKFDGNFELFREFVKNKSFDEIARGFDIPELAIVKNERGLAFIFNFLSYFSDSKKLNMTSLLSEKWENKSSQFNLVSFVPKINGIKLFFSDSKLSPNNYWSSESFIFCIATAPDIKQSFSVFKQSSIDNKAGIALLSLFRIKSKIIDRFDLLCDLLIAPFFEFLKSLNLSNSDELMNTAIDSSNSNYSVKNLLDDLWVEDAEEMANICLQFSSQSFPLIFIATPKKYQHYLYESKYVKFSTECAIYASSNKMIRFKDFLNKRIENFEDIAQNMTYNLESISDEILNDFFEFSLVHFADISRQCRNMIFSFYNQVKKVRKNCKEFDFTYSVKHATDILKFEASRRFESYMNSEITVKALTDIFEKQKVANQNLFQYMVAVLIAEFKFIESHTEQENQKIISILIELIKREIIDSNQTNNIFSLITAMLSSSDSSIKYDFSIAFIEKSIQFLGNHIFFASKLLLNDNFKKKSPSLYSKIDSTVKTFTFQNFSDFVPEIELHPNIKKFSNVAVPPQKKIKSLQPSFVNISLIPKSIEKCIEFSDWIATILVKKYLETPSILSSLIDVILSCTDQFESLFVQCCIYRFFSIMNEKDFDKGNSNGYLLRRNACLLGQLIGILTLSNNNPKNLRFLKIKNLLSYALSNGKLYGVVGFISSLLFQSSSLFYPPNPFTSSILGFLASISIIHNIKSHIKNQIETLFTLFNVSIDDFNLTESDNLFPDKTKNNFDFNSDLFNLSLLFSENQIERIISFDQNFYFCFISHCLILPKLKVVLPSQQQQQQQTPTKSPPNININTSQKRKRRNSSSSSYNSSLSLFTESFLIKEFNSQDRIRIIWDIFSLIKQFSKKLSQIIVSTVSSTVLKDLTKANDKSSILITAKQITKKLSASLVSQISFFDYQYIFSNYLANISLYPDSNTNTKLIFQQKILNELKKKVIEQNSFWIHQFLSEVTNALSLSHIKEKINNTKINDFKNNEIINLMKYIIPNQYLQLNIPGFQSVLNNSQVDKEDKNLFIYENNKIEDENRLLDHLDQNLFDYLCQIDQACTLEVMKGHRSFKEIDEKSTIHLLISEIPEIESKKASLQTFFVFFDANSFLLLLEVLVFLLRQIFTNNNNSIDNDSFISEMNDDSESQQSNKFITTPNRNLPQKRIKIDSDNEENQSDNENLQDFACLLLKKFILPPLAIQELISLNILTVSLVDSLFASILDSNDCETIYERQIEMIVSFLYFYTVEFPHFKPQDFIQSLTVCAFLPLFNNSSNQKNRKEKIFNNFYHQINSPNFNFNQPKLFSFNNYNNVILMKKVIKIRKVYFEFSTAQTGQISKKIDLFDNIEYASLFTKWKNAIKAANESQVVSITKSCSRMPQDFFYSIFEKESIDDIIKFLRCINKVCEIKSIQQNIYTALIATVSSKKKDIYKKIYQIIKYLQKQHSLNNSSLPFLLHRLRPLKYGEFTFLWISLISDPHFIVVNLQNEATITTSSSQTSVTTTTTNVNNTTNSTNSNNTTPNDHSINSSTPHANDKESTTDNRSNINTKLTTNDDIYSIGYAPLFVDFAASLGYLSGSHDPNVFQIVYKAFLRLSLVLAHDFPDFVASIALTTVSLLPTGFIQIRNILLSVAPRAVLPTSPLSPDVKIDHMSDVHQAAFNAMPLSLPSEIQTTLENLMKNLQLPAFSTNLYTTAQTANSPSKIVNNVGAFNQVFQGPISIYEASLLNLRPECAKDVSKIVEEIGETKEILPVIVEEVFNLTVAADDAVASGVMQRTPFLNSAAFRFFAAVSCTASDELVVNVVDCFVDQLRFRCRNTHFFSKVLIELFKMKILTANGSSLSEIIAVAILQRCALPPPHPWGLSVTVIELMSNKEIGFWDFPFSKSAFTSIQNGQNVAPAANSGLNSGSTNDKVGLFLKSIYYLFCNSNNNV